VGNSHFEARSRQQTDDTPFSFPQFNTAIFGSLGCLLDGLLIVGAFKLFEGCKT
jgi:hypothetical protein